MRITPVICCLALLPSLHAQQPSPPAKQDAPERPTISMQEGKDARVTVMFDADGMTLPNLLAWWSHATQRRFTYNEHTIARFPRLFLTGPVELSREDLDWFCEGILVDAGAALVPSGPPEAQVYQVEVTEQSQILKQRARYVPEQELDELVRHPAQVFMTTFALQHVEAQQVRGALLPMLHNRAAEHVQDLGPRAITAVGFGPTLAALRQVVRAADREDNVTPPPTPPGTPRGR